MRGPEAIEEVHEGNFGFQRGEVRNGSHIHNFLHGLPQIMAKPVCRAAMTSA